MAIYTTFFLCKPEELPGGFPGWQLPLPKPVQREFRNPFTGQIIMRETREPEWPKQAVQMAPPEYRAVAIQGRYEDYLENRLPAFVREHPHWAAKGLTEVEIEPLLRTIGAATRLEDPLYAPPTSGAVVQGFPPEFAAKLTGIDQDETARRWAHEMSSPENTHSVSGVKLNDGWTMEQALQILKPIVVLAGRAGSGQRMYWLIEA